MGKRARFPLFAGMNVRTLEGLIRAAHLGNIDQRIAVGKLLYEMDYADIGAAVGLERSSVAYRMKHIILPKLTRWTDYEEKLGA